MKDAVTAYFDGEQHAAVLLAGVGLAILAVAVVLSQGRWALRPLAATLAVVALAEIALGAGLYVRTGPQVSGLLAQIGADAARFLAEEGARLTRVQRNFVLVQRVELAVVVVSAAVAATQKHRFAVAGVALALLCHAAFLLAFDVVAERRGAVYQAALHARQLES